MSEQLRGWKDIAAYLGASVSSAQRWERELGLPVRRMSKTRGASVFGLTGDIDAWWLSAEGARARTESALSGGKGPPIDSAAAAPVLPVNDVQERDSSVPALTGVLQRTLRVRRVRFLPFSVFVTTVAILTVIWIAFPRVTTSPTSKTPAKSVAGIEAYSTPLTASVLVLRVTTAQGSSFLLRILDGTMATLALPGHAKIGLSVAQAASRPRLGVSEVTQAANGNERLAVVGTLAMVQGAVLAIPQHPDVHAEWIAVEQAPWSGGQSNAPPKCCVSCEHVTACATQVTGACGDCCGLNFTGCRHAR